MENIIPIPVQTPNAIILSLKPIDGHMEEFSPPVISVIGLVSEFSPPPVDAPNTELILSILPYLLEPAPGKNFKRIFFLVFNLTFEQFSCSGRKTGTFKK